MTSNATVSLVIPGKPVALTLMNVLVSHAITMGLVLILLTVLAVSVLPGLQEASAKSTLMIVQNTIVLCLQPALTA